MPEPLLTVLKFCLLALLYLFLVRVVWIVGRELRGTPAATPAPVAAPSPPPPPAARPRKHSWRFVVVEPATERGHAYDIDTEATIGRGGGCAILLTFDTFVSQVHARAFDRDGALWIEDLGSTNGTQVNGEKLTEPAQLRKGDRVKLGATVLEAERV
jgi:hypothetical protein